MAGVFGTGLDLIAWASIDGTNDMVTVCDANGDNAGTGPEDKRFAFGELAKRTLATADVSWLSTLAVSSIVQADDKFLVWDASATAVKVITGSDLLENTWAGTALPSTMSTLGITFVDGSTDFLPFWDASATRWRKIAMSSLLAGLAPSSSANVTSTPRTVSTTETNTRLSNYGATQVIQFNLPAGATGLRFTFLRQANYAMRLDPNGSELIGDGGAGKYLEITSRGQVAIEWVNGQWEVIGGSALYTMES